MADYYSKFSALIPFRSVEARACALALQDAHNAQWEERQPHHDEHYRFGVEIVDPATDGTAPLWVHDDGGSNVDGLIEFVQACARQKLCAGRRWSVVWSYDCSKPRLDGYGGGACVIDLETGDCLASLDLVDMADSIANGDHETVRIDVGMAATAHDVLCLEMAASDRTGDLSEEIKTLSPLVQALKSVAERRTVTLVGSGPD